MHDPDLQAHFEKIQKNANKVREKNLDSGLTCTLENLARYLNEANAGAATAYLENQVGIKALITQKHSFPESLTPKATLLQNVYTDLKNNVSVPLDLGKTITNFLRADAPAHDIPAANDPSF